MDWAQWASSLQGKLNKDVSTNITTQGKSYVSGLGFPSNRYIDLTLGASGSTYIAPANGYFVLSKNSTASGQYINISANKIIELIISTASGQGLEATLPVLKGVSATIGYGVGGTTNSFRFVYAEGDE